MISMRQARRGINLGGWLLVERWIPGVFDGVQGPAEIDIVKELGYEAAKSRLTAHRETFITEKDLIWIKKQGFDFVRLPVGYWLFKKTDDFIDGEVYIRRAFRWADKHGLGVILDFHGLQGSQNGKDHSGQVGKVQLYVGNNQSHALETLAYMARTYGSEKALLGIEVINEPHVKYCTRKLLRYYDRAYEAIQPHLSPDTKIIVSDAFLPLRLARALSKRSYASRLVLDVHLYQVFSARDQRMSFEEHVKKADQDWWDLLDAIQHYLPVLIGEWSAALPATAYANGVSNEAERVNEYYTAQKQTFDDAAWAHAYWTYKAPYCGVWSWCESRDILQP